MRLLSLAEGIAMDPNTGRGREFGEYAEKNAQLACEYMQGLIRRTSL